MEAVAWVLVTPDQRLIYVNTINGDASYNWDPGRYNNLPLPPREVLAKKLAKYTQIPVSQCPVAEEA